MITFLTENSLYEVLPEANLIRRYAGTRPPTVRQGDDVIWHPYVELSPIVVGAPVLITWAESGTLTSYVSEVHGGSYEATTHGERGSRLGDQAPAA